MLFYDEQKKKLYELMHNISPLIYDDSIFFFCSDVLNGSEEKKIHVHYRLNYIFNMDERRSL